MAEIFRGRPPQNVAFQTAKGRMIHGSCEDVLVSKSMERFKGNVNLIFTSPPFPLNRKKKYGNKTGDEYRTWLADLAPQLADFLSPDGSIVIELGNAWVSRSPTMSTLAIEALLDFLRRGDLHLCQEFIWHNPARLPSPAQWVNIERIRVKDSFTRLWWMSPVEKPKADNSRVLQEYSDAMKKLLERQSYNSGSRPSEHDIGESSFLTDNGGAIPSNVLSVANTRSQDAYQNYCRDNDLTPHPARMPIEVAEFFVRFLTQEDDLVLDPFAGSGTTCAAAEQLDRLWLGIEADEGFLEGAKARFELAALRI